MKKGRRTVFNLDQPAKAEASANAWDEAYRRVVEVHYALAEAGRVNDELHHWCLDKLNDLLGFIDQMEQHDRAGTTRPSDRAASS